MVGLALFAVDRSSDITVNNQPQHNMSAPLQTKLIRHIPDISPRFLQHIDLSVEEGGIPFSHSPHSHMCGWMRFKHAPQQLGNAHIIALADAWPPAPLQMLRQPAPASSMSWNLEFLHHQPQLQATDWLAYKNSTVQAQAGYAHTEGHLFGPQGELLVLSRQTVGIFD